MRPQGCVFGALSTPGEKLRGCVISPITSCGLLKILLLFVLWPDGGFHVFFFCHCGAYNPNIGLQNQQPCYLHSKDHICQSLTVTNGSKIVAPCVFEKDQ